MLPQGLIDESPRLDAGACAADRVACDGGCVDTARDPANCGSCGNGCAGAQVCAASHCDVSCGASDTRCAPSGVPPYCAALDSDPRNCGGCGLACPARAFAVSACRTPGAGMDAGLPFPDAGPSGAACGWTCQSGTVDLNGDLNAGPLAASDGCECHKLGDIDLPDLNNLDANCDGIVGDKAHAIFVSPLGAAGNPGTMALPVKTLAEAIGLAQAQGKDVYADQGTYAEAVTLVSGVSLFGGYASAQGWSRSAANVSVIQSPTTTGIIAAGLSSPTQVQLFQIQAADAAAGSGGSSVGVSVRNGSAPLTLLGCAIHAGRGGSGANGVDGIGGAAGAQGGPGGQNGGPGGFSACGSGGSGGSGGFGTQMGSAGNKAPTATGTNGQGGAGGDGGASGKEGSGGLASSGQGVSTGKGGAGAIGGPGGIGGAGSGGTGGPSICVFSTAPAPAPAPAVTASSCARAAGGSGGAGGGAAPAGRTGLSVDAYSP